MAVGHFTSGLITASMLAAATPMAASAQTSGATPVAEEAAAAEGIADIVVTARKTSESSQQVPIAITAVTAQRLTDLNVRDILDIQKVTPGLQISSPGTGGRAKIAIRGQSEADSRLTTDGSVGVYIDGVPLVRSYGLRSALVDIAQIEVLKGPQGTLFGKNTTGGALNITTQQPVYREEGYVDLVYGSYNNAQAIGVLNLPLIDDKLAVRVVGQVVTREGFGTDGNGRDVQDDNVTTGRIHLRADPGERVSILLSADFVRQRNAGSSTIITQDSMLANANRSNAALGAIAAQLGLNPASAADRMAAYQAWRPYLSANRQGGYHDSFGTSGFGDDLDHWGVSGTLGIDLGAVQFKSITAFRKLDRAAPQDLDGSPFDLLVVYLSTRQQNFSQEFQLSSIDDAGFDWQVGAFYNRETGNEFSANNTNSFVSSSRASVVDGDVRNTSKAIYAQATYHIGPEIRFTGGLRYTKDDRAIDSHNRVDPGLASQPAVPATVARCNLLSPALGGPVFPDCSYRDSTGFDAITWLASLDWRPLPGLMLYASNSRGYRAGGYSIAAASAVQTSLSQLDASFTPFDPETVTNYEFGFKSDLLDRRLRINGAAFLQDYKDIQVQIRDFIEGNSVTLIRNAAAAKLYGAELEVVALPVDHLTLTAAGSYLHARYDRFLARDTAGNLVDRSAEHFAVPEWTFNLGAAYELPVASGSLRFTVNYAWQDDVQYRPETPTLSGVSQSAYGLLDARIAWNIADIGLNIAVFCKNLTDKNYISAATNVESLGYNIGFPGDPRVFGVQLRKSFGQ